MALICSAAEVFQKMHSSLYSEDRYLYAQAVWLHWWNRSDKNRVEKYNLAHGPWHRHVPCTPTEKTKTTKRQLDERMNDRQIGNIYLPHHTAGPVLVDPSSWTPRSWDTMVTRMSPCSKGRTSKAVHKHIDRYKYQGRKMMICVSLSHINQDLLLPPAYRMSNRFAREIFTNEIFQIPDFLHGTHTAMRNGNQTRFAVFCCCCFDPCFTLDYGQYLETDAGSRLCSIIGRCHYFGPGWGNSFFW